MGEWSWEAAFHGSVHTATLAVATVLALFVLVLGFFGNGLVLLSALRRHRRRVRFNFDLLILNLAAADLLLCAVLAPLYLYTLFADPPWPRHFCGSLLFGGTGCGLMSLLTIVAIAVHRQARVSGRAKRALTARQTCLALAAVWTLSLAGAVGSTLHAVLDWRDDVYTNCQVLLYSPRTVAAPAGAVTAISTPTPTTTPVAHSSNGSGSTLGVYGLRGFQDIYYLFPASPAAPQASLSSTTSSSSLLVQHRFTLFFIGPLVVVSFVVIIVAYVVIARAVKAQSRARVRGLSAVYRAAALPGYRPYGGGKLPELANSFNNARSAPSSSSSSPSSSSSSSSSATAAGGEVCAKATEPLVPDLGWSGLDASTKELLAATPARTATTAAAAASPPSPRPCRCCSCRAAAERDSKALAMCLVVILTLVLCWSPLLVSHFLELLVGQSIVLLQVKLCGIALVFLNSALDPYMYAQNHGATAAHPQGSSLSSARPPPPRYARCLALVWELLRCQCADSRRSYRGTRFRTLRNARPAGGPRRFSLLLDAEAPFVVPPRGLGPGPGTPAKGCGGGDDDDDGDEGLREPRSLFDRAEVGGGGLDVADFDARCDLCCCCCCCCGAGGLRGGAGGAFAEVAVVVDDARNADFGFTGVTGRQGEASPGKADAAWPVQERALQQGGTAALPTSPRTPAATLGQNRASTTVASTGTQTRMCPSEVKAPERRGSRGKTGTANRISRGREKRPPGDRREASVPPSTTKTLHGHKPASCNRSKWPPYRQRHPHPHHHHQQQQHRHHPGQVTRTKNVIRDVRSLVHKTCCHAHAPSDQSLVES